MTRLTKQERADMRLHFTHRNLAMTSRMLDRCLDELNARDEEVPADQAVESLNAEISRLQALTCERQAVVKERPDSTGAWWDEDNNQPEIIMQWMIDSGNFLRESRWIKIEKPVFPPAVDPVAEKAKEIAGFAFERTVYGEDLIEKITSSLAGWTPPTANKEKQTCPKD